MSKCLGKILPSFQEFLQLIAVKAHDNLSVNHDDWGRHITKLLQFGQRDTLAGRRRDGTPFGRRGR